MINDAIRSIKTGVSVVTTKLGGRLNGLAIAWFSRVSMEPAMVMVSVGKTRYSHDMIKKSRIFCVNVLGEGQISVGKHFGLVSGKNEDKFEGVEYDVKKTGAPVLKECIAYLDCKLVNSCDAGDHTVFVGEVVDGGVRKKGDALIYDKDDFY